MRRLPALLVLALALGIASGFAIAIGPVFRQRILGEPLGMATVREGVYSMTEWVGAADLIIDGTVVDVQDTGLFTGWQDDGSVATVTPHSGVYDPTASEAVPLIETTVRVDTVYKDISAGRVRPKSVSAGRAAPWRAVRGNPASGRLLAAPVRELCPARRFCCASLLWKFFLTTWEAVGPDFHRWIIRMIRLAMPPGLLAQASCMRSLTSQMG